MTTQFGSYREAIQILERIKQQHQKHAENKPPFHPIQIGIYTLQSAIEALETADAQAQNEYSEYLDQYFRCNSCNQLNKLNKLKAIEAYGKTLELCETCHDKYKVNVLI